MCFSTRIVIQLYPDQGHVFGAAATLHGNELLHLEDYLISSNKLGFEDVPDSQLDEINFLFQTNHLPMCVFRPNSADREASSQSSVKPFSRTVGYSGASSTASDVHTSVQSEDSADAFCDILKSPIRNRRKRYSAVSSSSSCSEDFPFYGESSSSYTNQIRSGRIPIFTGPLSEKLFPPSQPPLSPTKPCQPVLKSLSNQMINHGLPPKTYTPEAPYPPSKFERLRGRQRTLTDISRLAESEDSDSSDAHASDSECYRFPDPPLRPSLPRQRQQSQERFAYSYGSGISKSLNSTLDTRGTFQGFKRDPFSDDFSDCSVTAYRTSLSNEQLSETDHSERHIRDVHILERLRVPFTYDEVAYSTNENFREMKATPGLSVDQITAMLDARRRATNRQAAERCRRGKSAARDSLANQLGRLRLERAHLTKRLVRTRKRRQCLR
ncbi:unnamed protein product [Dibothriocephalus latus]|uniref:Basic leucine zipper domain-containing protein n=1 Tax=Dibothriocephalus latus TaxID=60516 RepID=A0A3P7LDT5_DIBLA|nr:unnamed protein product [Dibothriocephalus latus]